MSCGCLKPKCGSRPMPTNAFHCDNDGRDIEFIDISEFLPRVTLVAKGVPDDIAQEYIRQACQSIARDSWLLKREVRLDVQAGVRDYYLEPGYNEQVHYIHGINFGKCGGRMRGCVANCGTPLRHYCDENFRFEPADKIILDKTPQADKESQLKVEYFAIPTQNACAVDKLLYDRYHDVVVNGALAKLLYMRQYSFADPQMAMLYDRQFKQGIAQAKIDVMRHFETGTQSFVMGGRI